MNKNDQPAGGVSIRLLACIAAAFLLPILLFASGPGWWASRNVTTGGTANDYAAANQGQLKNFATAAFNELNANLPGGVGDMTAPSGSSPGGTGYQLTALINSWSTTTSGTLVEITGSNTNDYAAVNLGQLKYVASLFYNRLVEVGYTSNYPWAYPFNSGNPPNDYAVANIGQMKNLFSFDVTTDTSGDGIPDWWESYYFGVIGLSNIGLTGTSPAPNGLGMTIQTAYSSGVSPVDYYNGVPPTLTIISGNSQTGAPSTLLSSPLVVKVTGTSGSPLVNAPVTFAVTQGAGVLAPDNSGTSATSNTLQVITGTNGYAQIYFQQPFDASFTSTVSAFTEGTEADFTETTTSDTNSPAAPTNVATSGNLNGSVLVTWTDNSDNETGFTIQRSDDGGVTWTTVGTVGADGTSFLVPASDAGTAGSSLFQAIVNSSEGNATSPTSASAIQPLPTVSYTTLDISGESTVTGTGTADVLSMALGDNNQAAYCFVSGTLSGTDSLGNPLSGASQIIVKQWSGGTTSSGTIGCDSSGTSITYLGYIQGLRNESLNADAGLYQGVSGAASMPYPGFSYYWLESQYALSAPPPSVILMPNGNAFGTVMEACYTITGTSISGTTLYPGSPQIDSPFSWTWISGSSERQIQEFTNSQFAGGTGNLLVNNAYVSTLFYTGGIWGSMVLGCSQSGYYGVGAFGVCTTGTGYNGFPAYFCNPMGDDADFLVASYICTSSGTYVFYDPGVNSNATLSLYLSGVTATGTAFTPAAMNDSGNAAGGPYYWNGTSGTLILLGTNAVATELNNQNMVIGSTTATGTQTGMLWLVNSGSAVPITMQSLVEATAYKNEISYVIPYAISGTDAFNRVSILCSGSVTVGTDTATLAVARKLLFKVNPITPSGTATPPWIGIAEIPADIHFQCNPAVNSSGIVSGVGDLAFTGTDGEYHTTPEKALGLAQVDISITCGYGGSPTYPNAPPFRTEVDQVLAAMPGLIKTDTHGDTITYVYNGQDRFGNAKLWTVQTSSNRDSFLNALQSVPYVAYAGHLNCGLGMALKQHASSPDFTTDSIRSISDFLHFNNPANPQTAIPWKFLLVEYKKLAFPAASAIPQTATNYLITGFPAGALQDYLDNADNLRYPNDQGVGNGGKFILHGADNQRQHFTRTPPKEAHLPFLIVNTSAAKMPNLGYKIFLDMQCYSCRDYSNAFNHGTFIGTVDETNPQSGPIIEFVTTLINGGSANDIKTNFHTDGFNEYAQKNF